MHIELNHKTLKQATYLLISITLATIGLKGFIIPNGFIDGGVMGITLLVNRLSGLPIGLMLILINAPFIVMGFRQMGWFFVVKTLLSILGLALALTLVKIDPVTDNHLLTAVFGGAFVGSGIGFAMRGGAVIDGTEVLAVYLSRKLSATIGDFILVINILIFAIAAVLLNVETALFSILTYLAASKAVDFIIEGVDEYVGVNVVSNKSEEIRQVLTDQLGRGVTIFHGKRGYRRDGSLNPNIDIVFCIITRLEIPKTKSIIKSIDPKAFIYTFRVTETLGGMVKKRPLH